MSETNTIPTDFEVDLTLWGTGRGGLVLAVVEGTKGIDSLPESGSTTTVNQFKVRQAAFCTTKKSLLTFTLDEPVSTDQDGSMRTPGHWRSVRYKLESAFYSNDVKSYSYISDHVIKAQDKENWKAKCEKLAEDTGKRVISFWLDGSIRIYGTKAVDEGSSTEGGMVAGNSASTAADEME